MFARSAPWFMEKDLMNSCWKRGLVDYEVQSCSLGQWPIRLMSSYCKHSTCSTTFSSAALRSRNAITASNHLLPAAQYYVRPFSSGPSSDLDTEFEGLTAQRNKSIIMNPAGQGQHILPGGFILKKDPKKGGHRRVFVEHSLGYFWAIKDLANTNKKPILSNETIVPAAEAEKFPFLGDMISLKDEKVSIPDFFIRNNRSKDASAKCTLVAISYKDFGAQLLPSWIDPFDQAFRQGTNNDTDRYDVVRIVINEGRVVKLLSPFITSGTKKNVPESDHANTLLYFGDAEEFRDILRMHNIYTGYVFLVDGIGRVRWAGSGEGTDEEIQLMLRFAQELTTSEPRRQKQLTHQSQVPRIGKRIQ